MINTIAILITLFLYGSFGFLSYKKKGWTGLIVFMVAWPIILKLPLIFFKTYPQIAQGGIVFFFVCVFLMCKNKDEEVEKNTKSSPPEEKKRYRADIVLTSTKSEIQHQDGTYSIKIVSHNLHSDEVRIITEGQKDKVYTVYKDGDDISPS